ncbi:MAG: GreA/GreB family elongation factor [Dehalococcoidia bacterium]
MVVNELASVQEVIMLYIGSLSQKSRNSDYLQELYRFSQWCGPDKQIDKVSAPEIGDYNENAIIRLGIANSANRLTEVKKLLVYAYKEGFITQNLAQHVRLRRPRKNASSNSGNFTQGRSNSSNKESLTKQGVAELNRELESLKKGRQPIADEIKRAAADGDVKENAPLEFARQEMGKLVARIDEIENMLANYGVIESNEDSDFINLGSKVVLLDVKSKKKVKYMVVAAPEARPFDGRISNLSPIGKAVYKKSVGEVVDVKTPRGLIKYEIIKVS